MTGLIVPPGQGRKLITKAQEVTFKATKDHGSSLSVFEVVVPPGFDVGAHVHHDAQEFFYVLEGELELLAFEPERRTEDSWHRWTSPDGDRITAATEGAFMFVPRAPRTPSATPPIRPPACSSSAIPRRTTSSTSRRSPRSGRRAARSTRKPWNACGAATTSTS